MPPLCSLSPQVWIRKDLPLKPAASTSWLSSFPSWFCSRCATPSWRDIKIKFWPFFWQSFLSVIWWDGSPILKLELDFCCSPQPSTQIVTEPLTLQPMQSIYFLFCCFSFICCLSVFFVSFFPEAASFGQIPLFYATPECLSFHVQILPYFSNSKH